MQIPIVQGEVMSLQRSAQQGERSAAPRLLHHQPISPRLRLAKLADQGHALDSMAQPKRRQQTGKTGARKKAEINESEPSGTNSELRNVDALESYASQVQPLAHICDACSSGYLTVLRTVHQPPCAGERLRRTSLYAIMRFAAVAMSARVSSAPSLKTRCLLGPYEAFSVCHVFSKHVGHVGLCCLVL